LFRFSAGALPALTLSCPGVGGTSDDGPGPADRRRNQRPLPATPLAGLVQVDIDSRARHIRAGRRGAQLRDAVADDVRRAAELLETGLAPLSRGTQAGGRNGPG
jgi:hypothetical protein